jgi:F0F1-type ATP synthase delta subunit
LDESKDLVLVKVTSKIKLSESNLNKIEKTLKNRMKKNIKIEEIIDKNLSSGIKIEYDGEVIDLTVKRTIDEIKNQLLGGN